MKPAPGWVWLGASASVVVTAVVAGLVVLGSPAEERARRLDRRRVADLRGIAAATDLYRTRHERLPASLDELTAEPGVRIRPRDPGGAGFYDYRTLDSLRYEVCADFEGESEGVPGLAAGGFWAHGVGRQCFRLEARDVAPDGVGGGCTAIGLGVNSTFHAPRSPRAPESTKPSCDENGR